MLLVPEESEEGVLTLPSSEILRSLLEPRKHKNRRGRTVACAKARGDQQPIAPSGGRSKKRSWWAGPGARGGRGGGGR